MVTNCCVLHNLSYSTHHKIGKEWLTVNCYFVKIASVMCDFDGDGLDGLLQTAHYSTLL